MILSKLKRIDTDASEVAFPQMFSHKNGFIVLFTSATTGIVVYDPGKYHHLGKFSPDWVSCKNNKTWTPFYGSIELESKR